MPKSQAIEQETVQKQGFLLIDKPAGMTSHDVVDRVRSIFRAPKMEVGGSEVGSQRSEVGSRRSEVGVIRPPTSDLRLPKVGHSGTLDPFATGLLIVGVGRGATREMQKLVGLDKRYEATFVLGASSTTDDTEGEITPAPLTTLLTVDPGFSLGAIHVQSEPRLKPGSTAITAIEEATKQFIGDIDQIPPTYSAIKIGGKKMYESARAGKPIVGKPRRVTVYSFDILDEPTLHATRYTLHVHIHCSSGTYIRSLARDLGRALGGGGYVEQLRRTSIGPFTIEQASTLENLETTVTQALIPVEDLLSQL